MPPKDARLLAEEAGAAPGDWLVFRADDGEVTFFSVIDGPAKRESRIAVEESAAGDLSAFRHVSHSACTSELPAGKAAVRREAASEVARDAVVDIAFDDSAEARLIAGPAGSPEQLADAVTLIFSGAVPELFASFGPDVGVLRFSGANAKADFLSRYLAFPALFEWVADRALSAAEMRARTIE